MKFAKTSSIIAMCFLFVLACHHQSIVEAQDGTTDEDTTETNGQGPAARRSDGDTDAEDTGPDGSKTRSCRTLAETLRQYDFLSTLRAALNAADMLEPLRDEDLTATFLAPTNEAFARALDSLNLTASEALDNPLFLRRVLQLHIVPVPIPEDVMVGDTLRVPTGDFGSRMKVETSASGPTTFTIGKSSAELVDMEIRRLCEPAKLYIINDVLLPPGIKVPGSSRAGIGLPAVAALPGVATTGPGFMFPTFMMGGTGDTAAPAMPFFGGTGFTLPGGAAAPATGASPTAGAGPGGMFFGMTGAGGGGGMPFTFPGMMAAATPAGTGTAPAGTATGLGVGFPGMTGFPGGMGMFSAGVPAAAATP